MRASLYIVLILAKFSLLSQDLREQFDNLKKQQEASYKKFQVQSDSVFAQFILDSWHEVKMSSFLANPEEKETKPEMAPVFDGKEPSQKSWENLEVDTIVYLEVDRAEQLESPAYYPELSEAKLNYWGADVKVRYPVDLSKIKLRGEGKNLLSDYWLKASKTGYQVLLEDLITTKDTYNLPDYAFYLMVKSFVEKSGVDKRDQILQTWFLMSKASYACKVGFVQEGPVFLLGAKSKIYGMPYFTEEGVRYYAMGKIGNQLSTFKNPEKNQKSVDFRVTSSIELPLNPVSKKLSFKYKNKAHTVEIYYDVNVMNLLAEFPSTDLSNHLHSSACLLLKKSLHREFDPLLEGMSQVDKVRLLLAFIQSMPYKTDQDQFEEERIFYPDEFFAYEYSDCDDRTVFLAYLIKEFVGLDIVSVTFPRHVALAVKLGASGSGENVEFQGAKYTLCDPTYFNAPIGAVIPQAEFSEAMILPIGR